MNDRPANPQPGATLSHGLVARSARQPTFPLSWSARLLHALVRGYQLFFSAWIGGRCRFTPTCSAYALDALERHGAFGGSYLAARRLLRCHPLCAGGHDPVPVDAPPWVVVRRSGQDAARPASTGGSP